MFQMSNLTRYPSLVSGDHIIAGTSDSRFIWFDVELGNVPFKKMR